jgi:hypothetical protein
MANELQQEYPYAITNTLHNMTGKGTVIYFKFMTSMPAKQGPLGPLMEVELSRTYNAIVRGGIFYFKTEADRTMFLLRFS